MKVMKKAQIELNFYIPKGEPWQTSTVIFINSLPKGSKVIKITKAAVAGKKKNENVPALKYHVTMPYSVNMVEEFIKALEKIKHLFCKEE